MRLTREQIEESAQAALRSESPLAREIAVSILRSAALSALDAEDEERKRRIAHTLTLFPGVAR